LSFELYYDYLDMIGYSEDDESESLLWEYIATLLAPGYHELSATIRDTRYVSRIFKYHLEGPLRIWFSPSNDPNDPDHSRQFGMSGNAIFYINRKTKGMDVVNPNILANDSTTSTGCTSTWMSWIHGSERTILYMKNSWTANILQNSPDILSVEIPSTWSLYLVGTGREFEMMRIWICHSRKWDSLTCAHDAKVAIKATF
jgi:hypothetical protein